MLAAVALLACVARAWSPLPPRARLALRQEDALRDECAAAAAGASRFEPRVEHSHEVAAVVLEAVARGDDATTTLWFPGVEDAAVVAAVAGVVAANADALGSSAAARRWPSAPAPGVALSPSGGEAAAEDRGDVGLFNSTRASDGAAVEASLRWVDDTLGALRLCPYTRGRARGAVGLEGVGVASGPVRAVAAAPGAASLAAAFFRAVGELTTTPERDLATTLLVSPAYDGDFLGFVGVCDGVVEPLVAATGAAAVVGRAWFHPSYEAAAVGHDALKPGHALPSAVVRPFVEKYGAGDPPSDDALAAANDAVRRSPHATINLLRRSQLDAAQRLEAALPPERRRPNRVYAANVQTFLDLR